MAQDRSPRRTLRRIQQGAQARVRHISTQLFPWHVRQILSRQARVVDLEIIAGAVRLWRFVRSDMDTGRRPVVGHTNAAIGSGAGRNRLGRVGVRSLRWLPGFLVAVELERPCRASRSIVRVNIVHGWGLWAVEPKIINVHQLAGTVCTVAGLGRGSGQNFPTGRNGARPPHLPRVGVAERAGSGATAGCECGLAEKERVPPS